MNLLLLSQKIIGEYQPRLDAILSNAGRKLAILPFTPELKVTAAQSAAIEAAYFSRDIWEGTNRSTVSPAASVFWPIVDAAPALQWLQVSSAGADQSPYQPSIRRGVRVTTGAGVSAEPVALTAFTGLLMLARGFPHWIAARQRREWAPMLGEGQPPDLCGQTAVIVGTGHIGSTIAKFLQAVGVKTVGVRRRVAPVEHFDRVVSMAQLDALLPACDWLVLACPSTPETRNLIDARRFALLPATAGFVNIARGDVIDETALIEALRAGRIRGAYLDVYATEPLPAASPLWDLPNVVMTPHNSATSTGNYGRAIEVFLVNLERYLNGEPLMNELARS